MQHTVTQWIGAIAVGALIAFSAPVIAGAASGTTQGELRSSGHNHESGGVHKGYFEDHQIKARQLSDWAGDWQSVYPFLQDGTLDGVMQHKSETGKKTAAQYKAYYQTGYATDVDRILIEGDTLTFFRDGEPLQAHYKEDGREVLTYKAGNRGVRYIFEKVDGDAAAPRFIQFSDHRIAPAKADHYHLYWGDDRAALLEELTNWPTYFPAALSGEEIATQMQSH